MCVYLNYGILYCRIICNNWIYFMDIILWILYYGLLFIIGLYHIMDIVLLSVLVILNNCIILLVFSIIY